MYLLWGFEVVEFQGVYAFFYVHSDSWAMTNLKTWLDVRETRNVEKEYFLLQESAMKNWVFWIEEYDWSFVRK